MIIPARNIQPLYLSLSLSAAVTSVPEQLVAPKDACSTRASVGVCFAAQANSAAQRFSGTPCCCVAFRKPVADAPRGDPAPAAYAGRPLALKRSLPPKPGH
jgi:hypothetical protein